MSLQGLSNSLQGLSGLGSGGGNATYVPVAADMIITLDIPLSRSSGLLWQDDAASVPAVADTDPIRRAVCPLTGRVFRSTADATRPILRNILGTWCAQGTGTQFFDMNPAASSTFTPSAQVTASASASINGLLSTMIDGATEVAGHSAIRYAFGRCDIWPAAAFVNVTPTGAGTLDTITTAISGDGVNNFLSLWFNNGAVQSVSGAASGSRILATRTPVILSGGTGSAAILTGFVRRAAFFNRAITEPERIATEVWAKTAA